jgi:hypothetical protein
MHVEAILKIFTGVSLREDNLLSFPIIITAHRLVNKLRQGGGGRGPRTDEHR